MLSLEPATHVSLERPRQNVDGRIKCGHDGQLSKPGICFPASLARPFGEYRERIASLVRWRQEPGAVEIGDRYINEQALKGLTATNSRASVRMTP